MGQGVRLSLIGMAGGLLAAALLARFLSSVLFGVDPHEPSAFAAAAVVLLAAALVASWLPARRVTCIDPMLVLRGE
jgi:ABC-type antimicrobial peptide transport system permease subunit